MAKKRKRKKNPKSNALWWLLGGAAFVGIVFLVSREEDAPPIEEDVKKDLEIKVQTGQVSQSDYQKAIDRKIKSSLPQKNVKFVREVPGDYGYFFIDQSGKKFPVDRFSAPTQEKIVWKNEFDEVVINDGGTSYVAVDEMKVPWKWDSRDTILELGHHITQFEKYVPPEEAQRQQQQQAERFGILNTVLPPGMQFQSPDPMLKGFRVGYQLSGDNPWGTAW